VLINGHDLRKQIEEVVDAVDAIHPDLQGEKETLPLFQTQQPRLARLAMERFVEIWSWLPQGCTRLRGREHLGWGAESVSH
jgi:hypothetical protein